MARIKINDLPKDMKIKKTEMRRVFGGGIDSVQTFGLVIGPGLAKSVNSTDVLNLQSQTTDLGSNN